MFTIWSILLSLSEAQNKNTFQDYVQGDIFLGPSNNKETEYKFFCITIIIKSPEITS